MNMVVLGCGKTGSLVAEVARERRHHVEVLNSSSNREGAGLSPEKLKATGVVIDFTTPQAVLGNILACARAGKNMVVGTTGWYGELPKVKQVIEQAGTGLVYGANFSIGVNLFFDIARTSAAAMQYDYHGQIFERHHAQKKDAPSGTASAIQKILQGASGKELEITSFREGEVVGMHEIILESPSDRIYLCHDSKSRRGFAEGAVRAAEWIAGQKGLFDFKDVWREL
ncbi:MAG TPA: dihydrodipicolinate reductase C-terminal domain-containing protein [Terriglobales bacterium]|nr:dihydrodipicolinate reductase C-terminal domain-containing protein [Terriglobales bacterium]